LAFACWLAEHIDGVTMPQLAEAFGTTEDGGSHPPGGLSKVHLSIGRPIRSSTIDRSPVGLVIADIKHLAMSHLSTHFSRVSLLSNVVAYILTRS
jgi:hypothetical protein